MTVRLRVAAVVVPTDPDQRSCHHEEALDNTTSYSHPTS